LRHENRQFPESDAATGHSAHQRTIRRVHASRPAAVDATGVSHHAKRAGSRLARDLGLAQTHGQPGEQSPFAAAAARRRADSKRTERFAPPRAENNSDEFFATLFRLLQEQLGERLDCPSSSITEAVIDERLVPLGTPEPSWAGLRELFQLCNQARYAPMRTSGELPR